MNTQSHVLLGVALFSRREVPGTGIAAVMGSLAPDLPLYALFAIARMSGYSNSQFFRDMYWREPVPTMMGASHSFIIYGVLLLVGLVLWRRQEGPGFAAGWAKPHRARFGQLLSVFSLAALIHALFDFLLHNDDAHMQFWPLLRWQFHSPVSYWNPAHYGNYWGLAEAALGIVCAVVIWRRYPKPWVRVLCAVAIAMYVAVPAYFVLSIADHAM
jgi:membrane-bound metal-dependent hydrolase YbcI (DUF457 family)